MKPTLLVPPQIRQKPLPSKTPTGKTWESVFLTNPLYQESLLPDAPAFEIFKEEAFLDKGQGALLNETAKRFAQTWHQELDPEGFLSYQGISLGNVCTRLGTYAFLAVLKAVAVLDRFLAHQKVEDLWILDDGGPWTRAAQFLCEKKGIRFQSLKGWKKAKLISERKNPFKELLRALFESLNHLRRKKVVPGGILYSASLRYAFSFLSKKKKAYYLREVFSWKGFWLSQKYSFYHFLPQTFAKPFFNPVAREPKKALRRLEKQARARRFFEVGAYDLWPLMKPYLEGRIFEEFPKIRKQIDQLNAALEILKPSAVVVEEDVCVFNKTLVLCAKERKIPTYVMVHGNPIFDIGTIPLTADRVLVWGKSCKERLMEWGVAKDQIHEMGAAHYEGMQEQDKAAARQKVLKKTKFTKGTKILLAGMSPFRNNDHPDFLGTPLTAEANHAMIAILLRVLHRLPEVSLVIKFHPAEKHAWALRKQVAREMKSVRSRVCIFQDEDTRLLVQGSDLVVTYGSTVYSEALLARTPALNFDLGTNRFFEIVSSEFLDLENAEASEEALVRFFKENLAAEKQERQEAEIQNHFFDANAHIQENIANFLKQIERKTTPVSKPRESLLEEVRS